MKQVGAGSCEDRLCSQVPHDAKLEDGNAKCDEHDAKTKSCASSHRIIGLTYASPAPKPAKRAEGTPAPQARSASGARGVRRTRFHCAFSFAS